MRILLIIGFIVLRVLCWAQTDTIKQIDLMYYHNAQKSTISFNQGIDFFHVNEYGQALSAFNSVIDNMAIQKAAFKNGLECAYRINKSSLYRQLQKVFEIVPDDELYHLSAEYAMKTGFLPSSKELIDIAIEMNPDKIEYYRFRADLHEKMKQIQASIDDYNTLLQMDKKSDLYYDRALMLLRNNQRELALQDLLQSFKYDQHNNSVLVELAGLYYYKKDYEEASKYLNQIDANSKEELRKANIRSLILMQQQKYDQALSEVEKYVFPLDADPIILNNIGNYSNKLNLFYQAESFYSKAIMQNDQNAQLYHNRGVIYELIRDMDKACYDWSKASKMGIELSNLYYKQKCK